MKHHFAEVMHRRREALQPSLDLRKHYLEATTAQQQRVERDAIMRRVFRLQPGPRKAFMVARLEALNAPQTLQPPTGRTYARNQGDDRGPQDSPSLYQEK